MIEYTAVGHCAYALLGHAVSTVASVEDARRIVEGFADEFGLLATAQVLAYTVALASMGLDPMWWTRDLWLSSFG